MFNVQWTNAGQRVLGSRRNFRVRGGTIWSERGKPRGFPALKSANAAGYLSRRGIWLSGEGEERYPEMLVLD